MECKIVRDLMQLYIEDLCSEESKKKVDTHTCECAECKEYLEKISREYEKEKLIDNDRKAKKENAELIDDVKIERELNPFKKLKRKLWFRCIIDVFAIIFAFISIIVVVNLFIWGFDKIDVYRDEVKIKRAVQALVNGDEDNFLEALNFNAFDKEHGRNAWIEDCRLSMNAFYENYIVGQNVKVKIDSEKYFYLDNEEWFHTCTVQVGENGFEMYFGQYTLDGLDLLYVNCTDGNLDVDTYFDVICQNKEPYEYLIKRMASIDENANYDQMPKIFNLGVENNIDDKILKEKIWHNLCELWDEGISLDASNYLDIYYNEKLHDACGVMLLEFSDSNNLKYMVKQEVLLKTLTPTEKQTEVIGAEYSEEMKTKLEGIFH